MTAIFSITLDETSTLGVPIDLCELLTASNYRITLAWELLALEGPGTARTLTHFLLLARNLPPLPAGVTDVSNGTGSIPPNGIGSNAIMLPELPITSLPAGSPTYGSFSIEPGVGSNSTLQFMAEADGTIDHPSFQVKYTVSVESI